MKLTDEDLSALAKANQVLQLLSGSSDLEKIPEFKGEQEYIQEIARNYQVVFHKLVDG